MEPVKMRLKLKSGLQYPYYFIDKSWVMKFGLVTIVDGRAEFNFIECYICNTQKFWLFDSLVLQNTLILLHQYRFNFHSSKRKGLNEKSRAVMTLPVFHVPCRL